jgi:8-oxo-dGTP diphosphatase/2-hydroxy-dATP diphosphatase
MQQERKLMTVCVIYEPPRVLLGMKKRGFGAGRWNGFGGKVGADESIEAAARRELKEEAGIEVSLLERAGVLEFTSEKWPEILEVYFFRGSGVIGDPKESEEMIPQWFGIAEIPFDEMWPDDRYWFPLFFAGKKFRGSFFFDASGGILTHTLSEVQEL